MMSSENKQSNQRVMDIEKNKIYSIYFDRGISFEYPINWEERKKRWLDYGFQKLCEDCAKGGLEVLVAFSDVIWRKLGPIPIQMIPKSLAVIFLFTSITSIKNEDEWKRFLFGEMPEDKNENIRKMVIEGQHSYRISSLREPKNKHDHSRDECMYVTKDYKTTYFIRCSAIDVFYEEYMENFEHIFNSFRIL